MGRIEQVLPPRERKGAASLQTIMFITLALVGKTVRAHHTPMLNPFDPGYFATAELREMGFARVGQGVSVARNNTIIGLENITLGDGARIDGFCTIIAASGSLVMGAFAHIHTNFVLGCRGGIEIGDYAGISHGCHVLSASDDFSGKWMTNSNLPKGRTNPKIAPIRIGRHVPIGTGCSIFPGVTIGEGAAICSHSVISRDLPEWMMCSGNPARPRVPRSRQALMLESGIRDRAQVA